MISVSGFKILVYEVIMAFRSLLWLSDINVSKLYLTKIHKVDLFKEI